MVDIIDNVLPVIDGEVSVVPLPTINRHIHERGFDHMLKIARGLSRRRGYKTDPILRRVSKTVQVGSNKLQRSLQAASTYEFRGKIDSSRTYILIDDVWTTGASMRAAIKKLQQAGASKIIVLILAVNRVGVDN